jgi:hypothetical protein
MTDREEKILQKYTALEGWCKRARDLAILGNKKKLKDAFYRIWKCVDECERLE